MSESIFESDIIRRVIEKNIFKPRDDAILVYETKLAKTAGGILLPDKQDHKASLGYAKIVIVIAVGPGRFIEMTGKYKSTDLEPGDAVLVSAQAGLELGQVVRRELGSDLAHEALRIIRAHDILMEILGRNLLQGYDS